MIDTIAGAESSAIIYSIAETAKANNLKPYDYFEYLLTEIPKHLVEKDSSFAGVLTMERLHYCCDRSTTSKKRNKIENALNYG